MEESRRQFMLQTAQRSALAAGGLMLLDPVDLLGATLGRYHVVKRGDNLTLIAKRHGTTVSNLKIWNGLTSDVIIPGQKLYLRPQHSSLPLTTINRPRVNAAKWKNIIAHHSATGNGNAKIFDAAHLIVLIRLVRLVFGVLLLLIRFLTHHLTTCGQKQLGNQNTIEAKLTSVFGN